MAPPSTPRAVVLYLAALAASLVLLPAPSAAQTNPNPQLALNFCNPSSPSQLFYFDSANSTVVLASSGQCIDILAYGTSVGSEAYTAPCHHDDKDPSHQNQEFEAPSRSAAAAAPLLEIMSGLAIDGGGALAPSSPLSLQSPTPDSAVFLNVTSPANNGTGTIVHAASGLCFDAGGVPAPSQLMPVALGQCGSGTGDSTAPRQVFAIPASASASSPSVIALALPSVEGLALCLTVSTSSPTSPLVAAPCPPPGTAAIPAVQSFYIAASGNIVSAVGQGALVVDAGPSSPYWAGLPVGLDAASAASAFAANTTGGGFAPGTGRLTHTASGLCLDVGGVPNSHGCLDRSVRSLPFCNPALDVDSRVADLLSRLTVAEKIGLTGSRPSSDTCDTVDPGVPRLFIPPFEWLVEANSMAASACYGQRCATAFPSSANLAAGFNESSWLAKGSVVSTEMRALNNLRWHRADGQAGTIIGLSGYGPDINQPRDPRNGRQGELPTEDPFLSGRYAVQYVRGMQEGAEDTTRLKMIAGIKHFALYSRETQRFSSRGNFSLFDVWDSYLPQFESAFVEGGVAGSMCSYMSFSLNGSSPYIPACGSSYLLTDVVRSYWGRPDATHLSDCGAVSNMANQNHFVSNFTYAAAVALNAGMNINSNNILPTQLQLALDLGLTTEAQLDAMVSGTLALRVRAGILDPLESQPFLAYGAADIGAPQARQLVQDAVAQGTVLVRNNKAPGSSPGSSPALPLKKGSTIAVVGPLASDSFALMGDYYADDVCPTAAADASKPGGGGGGGGRARGGRLGLGHDYSCVPTIAAALAASNAGGSTPTFPGVQMHTNDTATWAQALAAVAAADATVMVLGTDQTVGMEGTDLGDIGLPGVQSQFGLAVLAAAAGKPVTLLLVGSFPTSFDALAASPALSAVVIAYAPGFGAPAISSLLFGDRSTGWGRATYTIYPYSYQSAVSLYDYSMTPSAASPGRTYRYFTADNAQGLAPPLVRFGEGLPGYSTFALSGCSVSFDAAGGDCLRVNCTVALTSFPASAPSQEGGVDEVIMVYHRASPDVIARIGGRHPVPASSLVGFQRLTVPAAASAAAQASIPLTLSRSLCLVDETGASVLYPGLHFLDVWDGTASNNVTLAVEIREEEARVVRRPPPFRV